MPSGKIAEVLLRYRVDNSSLNQTVTSTQKLQRSLESVRESTLEAFKNVPKSVEKLRSSFGEINKNLERTSQLAEVVGGNVRSAFGSQTSSRLEAIASANREIKDSSLSAADALEREARALSNVSRQSVDGKSLREAQGDVSTSLGALASVTNLGGTGAIGQSLAGAGDVFGFLEYKDKLIAGVQEIGTSVTRSQGALGGFARKLQETVPGLGQAGAGLVTLAGGLGVVTAATALLSAAQQAYNQQQQIGYEALVQEIGSQAEIMRLRREGDVQGAELLLAQTREQLQAATDKAAASEEILANLRANSAAQTSATAQNIGGAFILGVGAAANSGNEAGQEFIQLGSQLNSAGGEAQKANQEVDTLSGGLDDLTTLVTDLGGNTFATTGELEKFNTTLNTLESDAQRAETAIASLSDQRREVIRSENQRLADLEEDRLRQQGHNIEDAYIAREQAESKHQENLTSIAARGQAQIAKLNEQLNNIAGKLQSERGKLFSDFAKSDVKAEKELGEQLQKIEAEYLKKRRDINQQYADKELDAQLNNSVLTLLQAERDKDQQLAAASEGADEAEKERIAQRSKEREAAREQLQEKLTGLQQQAEADRANIAAQIEATRAATDAEIAETQRAFEERQKLEDAERERQAKRQAELEKVSDARAARALNEQLSSIDKRLNAERSMYGRIQSELELTKARGVNAAASIGAAFTLMGNALIAGFQAQVNSTFGGDGGGSATFGGSSGSSGSGGFNTPTAFADGGMLKFANYKPGDTVSFGERGMEVGQFEPGGLRIYSAADTSRMLGGGGSDRITTGEVRDITATARNLMRGAFGQYATRAEVRSAFAELVMDWAREMMAQGG